MRFAREFSHVVGEPCLVLVERLHVECVLRHDARVYAGCIRVVTQLRRFACPCRVSRSCCHSILLSLLEGRGPVCSAFLRAAIIP